MAGLPTWGDVTSRKLRYSAPDGGTQERSVTELLDEQQKRLDEIASRYSSGTVRRLGGSAPSAGAGMGPFTNAWAAGQARDMNTSVGEADVYGIGDQVMQKGAGLLSGLSWLLDRSTSAGVGLATGEIGRAADAVGMAADLAERVVGDNAVTNVVGDAARQLEEDAQFDDTVPILERALQPYARAVKGLTGTHYGAGDFGALRFQEDDSAGERNAKAVGAFVVDTLSDPLTYLTLGGSAIGKKAASAALNAAAKEAAKRVLASGAEDATARLAGRFTTTVLDRALKDGIERQAGETAEQVAERVALEAATPVDRAAEVLASDLVDAYQRRGAKGLREHIGSIEDLTKEQRDELWTSVPRDVRGGVRVRAPFAKDEFGTPLSAGFGGGGAVTSRLGLGRAVDAANDARYAVRASRPAQAVGRRTGGATGGAYSAYVTGLRNADDPVRMTYREYANLTRLQSDMRVFTGALGRDAVEQLGSIEQEVSGKNLAKQGVNADEAQAAFRRFFQDRGSAGVVDEAALSAAERVGLSAARRSHALVDELRDRAVAEGADIGFIDGYSARLITDEYRSHLAVKRGAGGGVAGRGEMAGKSRTGAYSTAKADGAGSVTRTYDTVDQANLQSDVATGLKVFEDDPLKVLQAYARSYARAAAAARMTRQLRYLGLVTVMDVTPTGMRALDMGQALGGLDMGEALAGRKAAQLSGRVDRRQRRIDRIAEKRDRAVSDVEALQRELDGLTAAPRPSAVGRQQAAAGRAADAAQAEAGRQARVGQLQQQAAARVEVLTERIGKAQQRQAQLVQEVADARSAVKAAGKAAADGSDVPSEALSRAQARLGSMEQALTRTRERLAAQQAQAAEMAAIADGTLTRASTDMGRSFLFNAGQAQARAAQRQMELDKVAGIAPDVVADPAARRAALERRMAARSEYAGRASRAVDEWQKRNEETTALLDGLLDDQERMRDLVNAIGDATSDDAQAMIADLIEVSRSSQRALGKAARREGVKEGRQASPLMRAVRDLTDENQQLRNAREAGVRRVGFEADPRTGLDVPTSVRLPSAPGDKADGIADYWATEGVRDFITDYYAASSRGGMQDFVNSYVAPPMAVWRTWVTVGRGPGYVARNVMGGAWNNFLMGVTSRDGREAVRLVQVVHAARRQAESELKAEGGTLEYGELTRRATELTAERLKGTKLGERVLHRDGTTVAELVQHLHDFDILGRTRVMEQLGRDVLATGDDATAALLAGSRQVFQAGAGDGRVRKGAKKAGNATVDNAWINANSALAQRSEEWLRVAAFLAGARRFGTKSDGGMGANLLVKAAQFDYGDLSQFERYVLKNIIPFYTWTRNNLPLQLRAVLTDPGKVSGAMRAQETLRDMWGYQGEQQEGIDYDSPFNSPQWRQEKLGFAVPPESLAWLPQALRPAGPISVGADWLPLTDLNSFIPAPGDLANLNAWADKGSRQYGSMLSPLIKAPLEAWTGQDLATGDAYPQDGMRAGMLGEIASRLPLVGDAVTMRKDGELYQQNWFTAAQRNLLPPVAWAERILAPGADALAEAATAGTATPGIASQDYRDRWGTSLASTLLGLPVSTLTEKQVGARNQDVVDRLTPALNNAASDMGLDRDLVREAIRRYTAAGFGWQEAKAAIQQEIAAGAYRRQPAP